MSETFGQAAASLVADYGGGQVAQAAAYVAAQVILQYALARVEASLGASKPKGEGRGLEVSITDTGAAGFALYGTVRVGGCNVIPV